MKKPKNKKQNISVSPVQTAHREILSNDSLFGVFPENADTRLYSQIRTAVPIISAAIDKIVRLVGSFEVECKSDKRLQNDLNSFLQTVKGTSTCGINSFMAGYLDCLLTKGTAVGEIVLNSTATDIAGLYNAVLSDVSFKRGNNPFEVSVCQNGNGTPTPVKYPQLVFYSALKPEEGQITGNSLLKGLPYFSKILMKIYESIGSNFERMGNLRYAVTYKGDDSDRVNSKERAKAIAKEWAAAMQPGTLRDFVAVGDVDVKVIGADAQMMSTEIPVRQILEQIVAKTGIPPFMLGLSWSTTERMSAQQADILTSELEYYRELLTSVILKICNLWQAFRSRREPLEVVWSNISLQDEVELAKAELYNAQAQTLCSSSKGNSTNE